MRAAACALWAAVATLAATASVTSPLVPVGLERVVGAPGGGPVFFSWALHGGGRGSWQAGFQLRLLDAAGAVVLAHDGGAAAAAPRAVLDIVTLLRSGAGAGLRAGGEYAVRVRDGATGGWSGWARAPFHWGAGPARGDWTGADWVCTGPDSTDARSSMLRAAFTVSPGNSVSAAALHIAGLGQFTATLNGARVSAATNEPGWTDFRSRVLYSIIDVAPLLKAGPNVLGVRLGNGFYNVPAPPAGRYTKFTAPPFGPRAVLAQLSIVFADGSTMTVNSVPGAWNATDGGAVVFTHQCARRAPAVRFVHVRSFVCLFGVALLVFRAARVRT